MISPSKARINRESRTARWTALGLLVGGIALGGLGVAQLYGFGLMAEPVAGSALARNCLESAAALGGELTPEPGGQLAISLAEAPTLREGILASSLIVEQCVGYEVATFCAGEDCGGDLLQMTLSRTP
ncbi:hypothetical protein VRRI112168_14925 [Vreelandella rituensis]|uniref:Uncharacterized protein n=1 Tax=Vreelandella rituensis TaxID=2282306 RepID=A0A368U9Z7_9GAMM|nr:hypothetical protein [Halomonas rituensis]RCV93784.1 hypothetical protein DU506_01105 [Halomonas rituensis]